MKKGLLIGFLMLFVAAFSFAQSWKVNVGDKAPAFELHSKDGKKVDLNTLKGKVVLINFFATWCPPCRKELPELQSKIWNRWKNRSDFYVVVLAREEGWDKLDPFMASNSYTFPVFPDLERATFSLFAKDTIPRNVVLNKEGEIIYQSIGYEEKEFTKLIALLEQELEK